MSVTKTGIVTRSLTLRRLFDLDASMTTEESGPWSLFQKRLHEETKGVRWPAAMPDLLAEVAELFGGRYTEAQVREHLRQHYVRPKHTKKTD